jgi:transcriptional regulator with XRE-family HTH domain
MNFSTNLRYLRKRTGKTQSELSTDLGIGRTTVANYEAGVSEPSIEILLNIIHHFGVTADMLLSRNLTREGFVPGTIPVKTGGGPQIMLPRVVTVDLKGNDNIIYVPIKARAGYLHGYGDPEFMETLPSFRLPGLNHGTYRMFEVEGPSMTPNLQPGDKIIGEWVEDISKLRDNHVYIIVHEGGVVVKRIINRYEDSGKIFLKSDTIAHRAEYPVVEIDATEIREAWYGKLKLSTDFTEPAEVYQRITDLETDVLEMKKFLKDATK